MKSANDFKVGDEVWVFDSRQKDKWSPVVASSERTIVTAIRKGMVYVDTCFGEVPYKPDDLEFSDAPF